MDVMVPIASTSHHDGVGAGATAKGGGRHSERDSNDGGALRAKITALSAFKKVGAAGSTASTALADAMPTAKGGTNNMTATSSGGCLVGDGPALSF